MMIIMVVIIMMMVIIKVRQLRIANFINNVVAKRKRCDRSDYIFRLFLHAIQSCSGKQKSQFPLLVIVLATSRDITIAYLHIMHHINGKMEKIVCLQTFEIL